MKRLLQELKQTKPFGSTEEAAYVAVLVTAERFKTNALSVFKASELTSAQYNVLRILRGAGKEGISCTDIAERMITHDSDITRMLDRLESRELLTRERQADDRRVVRVFIAKRGQELLAELDGPVLESLRQQLAGLSKREMEILIQLLDKARKA